MTTNKRETVRQLLS